MIHTQKRNVRIITRIVCIILTVIMIAPLMEYKAKAVTQHTVGQDAIDLIKSTEGFAKYKYWDYSQWSIGYGSRCDENDYPNGITEEEAEKLLKDFCKTFGDYVNRFAVNENVEFTQNQFDALVCTHYALGDFFYGYGDFALRRYIIDGSDKHSFLEIARGFAEWRKANGEVLQGLVKRRKLEIQLFLKNRTDKNNEVWRVDSTGGVNLREKPDVSSTKTGFMVYNFIFGITEKATDSNGGLWGKVHYEDRDQWVALENCDYYVGGPVKIDGKEQTVDPSNPTQIQL